MTQSTAMKFLVIAIANVNALELTPENWEKEVKGKTLFIKFYAPWCGHCKKIKPDWDRLMQDFKDSPTGLVAEVDCTASGKSICEGHGIKGYPGLMWGKEGSLQPYPGDRSYSQLKQFAIVNLGTSCNPGSLDLCDEKRKELYERFMKMHPDMLEQKVKAVYKQIAMAEQHWKWVEYNKTQEIALAEQKKKDDIDAIKKQKKMPALPYKEGDLSLTPENWEEKTKGKAIFVKFYAPWCGHCKSMKADWEKLMLDYHGTSTALVAEVDCTSSRGKELCDEHGISGFPRLLWGAAGETELLKYEGSNKGARDYTSLKFFAQEVLGETCGPENLKACEPSLKTQMQEFGKLSPEKRKSQKQSSQKAIEKVEKDFQDTHFSLLAALDKAEEEKNKRIKSLQEQGLAEAVDTHNWNKKQPSGFWKAPADANSGILFSIAGIDVTEFGASVLLVTLAIVSYFLYGSNRTPTITCSPRHILMKTEEDILKVKAQIEAGEDFEKMAELHSTCKSGEAGGALGIRAEGTMDAAINKVCFDPAIKIGELVGPIQSKFGYHLIRVDARKGVTVPAVETAKNK